MGAAQSLSRGVGVGLTMRRRRPTPFTFAHVMDLLLLDASTVSGSNGDHQATLVDGSGAGHNFTQSTDGSRPTLNTSWAGGKAFATNGSQWAQCSSPIVAGLSAFSVVWAGQFSTVAAARVAFMFGTNATDGIDWNANRNAAGKFGVFLRTVAALDTNLSADTNPHLVIITYDSAASPKWHIYIDGVDTTVSGNTATPATPTAKAIFGATDTVPNFGLSGNTGLLGVATGVWSASVRGQIITLAKSIWTGLP